MKKTVLCFVVFTIALAMVFSCSCSGDEPEDNDRIGVAVTILPQAEFVERIGGDRVTVTVMVPPGESPHTYEPVFSSMTSLAEADLYAKVGSGIDFELAWMDRLISANSTMHIVDCSQGITLMEPEEGTHDEHEAEEEEEEHHHDIDPHIWTSPVKAGIMARNIAEGLIEIDPRHQDYYEANLEEYLAELDELDRHIRDGLADVTNRVFMVYHPSFGYFASEYGLVQLPIEAEGKEPTGQGLESLMEQAREHDIKAIFVSPQFNPKSAEVIADEIGAAVISVDPLAPDYLDNMRHMAEQLITAME